MMLTLQRFEHWVCEHRQRTFSDEVLKQIDQAFPEERHKAQIGDTYAMRANAGLIKADPLDPSYLSATVD